MTWLDDLDKKDLPRIHPEIDEELEKALDSDRLWFSTNPDCLFRKRNPEAIELLHAGLSNQKEAMSIYIVVVNYTTGVRARFFETSPNEDPLRVVYDIDPGISKKDVEEAFDRYRRMERSLTGLIEPKAKTKKRSTRSGKGFGK